MTLALRRKHEKYSFSFFTNHDKEKAKQFMMMLGDHQAAHFVRQGVAVAVVVFHEKQCKFC